MAKVSVNETLLSKIISLLSK